MPLVLFSQNFWIISLSCHLPQNKMKFLICNFLLGQIFVVLETLSKNRQTDRFSIVFFLWILLIKTWLDGFVKGPILIQNLELNGYFKLILIYMGTGFE